MPTRTLSDERKKVLLVAAARFASQGEPQLTIAKKLQVSQATVSRFIQEAIRKNILTTRNPTFNAKNANRDALADADAEFFYTDEVLLEKLRPPSRPDFVMSAHSFGADVFPAAAAQQVVHLLERSKVAGLMWGRTVADLVHNLARPVAQLDINVRRKIKWVPLCGDPVFCMNRSRQQYSASRLAEELEVLFGMQRAGAPSLSGVPAYIGQQSKRPSSPKTEQSHQFQDFVERIPGFQSIFGKTGSANGEKKTPYIDRVDTIITGLGIVSTAARDKERGTFVQERLDQEKWLTPKALAAKVWGDMGGLLIGKLKDGNPDDVVSQLNAGWMGVRLHHFTNLAERAGKNGIPGVIALATGVKKARIVLEAARRGYINHVIIDADLAKAIKKLDV